MTLRYRKVGGLRFLRVARLQVSFCVVRRSHHQETTSMSPSPLHVVAAFLVVASFIMAISF